MIKALGFLYEQGLKDLSDFYEIPGSWLTYDFDNHPEMQLGIMTRTHALTIQVTINEYIFMINEANAI